MKIDHQHSNSLILPARRQVLTLGAAAFTTLWAPSIAKANMLGALCAPVGGENPGISNVDFNYDGVVPTAGPGEHVLTFINPHTGDKISGVYARDGQYDQDFKQKFDHLCRDWRKNASKPMDPRLLDLIYKIIQKLNLPEGVPTKINSGYRSPETNAGVGDKKQSYHMQAVALDIDISGASHAATQNAAKSMKMGGVGVYRNFTHVDTGPIRYW